MFSYTKNKIIVIFIIILTLFIFHHIGILTPIEDGARFIFSPAQRFFYSLSYNIKDKYDSASSGFKNKDDLKNENIYLKDRINELTINNITIDLLKSENERLKSLLNFVSENEYEYAVARVIGKGEGTGNTLILDKGEKDGAEIGLAVVNPKGMVIGKIFKCDKNTSEILFLNDNQSRIASSILNHSETNGVVEGAFELSMKMGLIPKNIDIKHGDTIITSGLEPNIPHGLVIGQVNEVEKKEGDLFQSANIQPLFPLESVYIVSVILPAKQGARY
ncbi:MAG: rod shape-determining protein MreC [bacterium]